MTLPIREYLAQRRADIQSSIRALRAELAEVDAAEKALAALSPEAARPRREREGGSERKTLKQMAAEALAEHPDGLEAVEILGWIERRYGKSVPRESMSPQLSRLRQEGVVVLDGSVWKLANPDLAAANGLIGKAETPGAATPGASEQEVDDEIAVLLG